MSEGIEIFAIVLGKKMGFSLLEINELRIQDLLDCASVYKDNTLGRSRKATQSDIDAFYAG